MSGSLSQAGSSATQRFRDRYGRILEWVVGGLMVVLAVEVTFCIVFRVMGNSLVWYDEVASVLLAWLTFYGSALASVKRGHIGCPEVIEQFAPGTRRVFEIIAQVLTIAFFSLLGWVGLTILPALVGESLVSLPIPMTVVQSVIPISAVLIVVAEVTYLIDLLGEGVRQRGQAVGPTLSDGLH
jgi:TRAP-type C4-dicarboxylate transport system permease small subunit